MEYLHPVRCVVTGVDEQGNSTFVSDGNPKVLEVPERLGYRVTNVWLMSETPPRIESPNLADQHRGTAPPPGGNILRVIDYPPDTTDPEERKRQHAAVRTKIFPGSERIERGHDGNNHPGRHRTDTIDYAIVLAGEMVAVMDDGERVLKAGDILVQRGTFHAWSNRSGKPARICYVLIDAKRE